MRSAAWMASTAWPSATLGARLNERVTAGNWLWWVSESAVIEGEILVTMLSGTGAPFADFT